MSLKNALLSTPERETGGKTATKRLGYQAQWALELVMRQHKTDEDYAIAVEFHDDVMQLDHSKTPNTLAFYQVKTKGKGTWTIGPLFARDKKKTDSASFMGKLFDNYLRFPDNTVSLNFVSNAPCSFLDSVVPDQAFSACKDAKDFENFKAKLMTECPKAKALHCDMFRFVLSDLSLGDPDGHTLGKLVQFVTDVVGQDTPFIPNSLYLQFTREFERRSKADTPTDSFDSLIKAKAVTRADMNKWLDAVRYRRPSPKWEEISGQLTYLPPLEFARLRKVWARYAVEAMDAGDQAILKVRSLISDAIDCCDVAWSWQQILTYCVGSIGEKARDIIPDLTDDKLKVMTLYEALSDENKPEVQAPDAQSEDTQE